MDGLIFLHDQAGQALQQAQAVISQLRARVAELEEQLAAATGPVAPEGGAPDQ